MQWEKQDQILLSWLLSLMTEGVLTRVVGCKRSSQVWSRVQAFLAFEARAKVRHYKIELRNIKKGEQGMNDYLLKIKSLVDALIAIGTDILHTDRIEAIF